MKQLLNIAVLGCLLVFASCNKFLDKKQDIKLVVPKSIEDAALLLNNYSIMNANYPILGEVGIDDYYVLKADWDAASLDHRNAYTWSDVPYMDDLEWQRPYRVVYYANQALEILRNVNPDADMNSYKRNLGAAHFYRGFVFQLLTEVYCPAYQESTASSEMGIPLRLSPGIDLKSTRASLTDTYKQIITDFQIAIYNLPVEETAQGRPSKSAAYAGIARAYLNMGDFKQAYIYADSCMQLRSRLMDYNSLSIEAAYPIPKFNVEVLFPAGSSGMGIMGNTSAIIADDLYQSYHPDDLRKLIFFEMKSGEENTAHFRGNYDQNAAPLFIGITTPEVYLIKAEAACRIGRTEEAKSVLNTLLRTRWDKTKVFNPIAENNTDRLLQIILKERRKELVFRGRRWADLKRLNLDPSFQKNLTRTLDGDSYTLPENDLRYAFRLSETVIRLGGFPQNKR